MQRTDSPNSDDKQTVQQHWMLQSFRRMCWRELIVSSALMHGDHDVEVTD